MDEILILGGGGHAKVLISVLKKAGWQVIGYLDKHDYGTVLGVSCLGNDDMLPELRIRHPYCRAAIGVGKIDAGSDSRLLLLNWLEELGFELPPIVSPQAVINEDVHLGAGTVVFDGVVVNSGSVAKRACILNSNCTIEHDCHLDDNVHIAPGATLSGAVHLGDHCMVGTGTNIIQGVQVAAGCLIGAGATVVNHLAEPGTYIGNPARKLR